MGFCRRRPRRGDDRPHGAWGVASTSEWCGRRGSGRRGSRRMTAPLRHDGRTRQGRGKPQRPRRLAPRCASSGCVCSGAVTSASVGMRRTRPPASNPARSSCDAAWSLLSPVPSGRSSFVRDGQAGRGGKAGTGHRRAGPPWAPPRGRGRPSRRCGGGSSHRQDSVVRGRGKAPRSHVGEAPMAPGVPSVETID
jgi:hypothetical protein